MQFTRELKEKSIQQVPSEGTLRITQLVVPKFGRGDSIRLQWFADSNPIDIWLTQDLRAKTYSVDILLNPSERIRAIGASLVVVGQIQPMDYDSKIKYCDVLDWDEPSI